MSKSNQSQVSDRHFFHRNLLKPVYVISAFVILIAFFYFFLRPDSPEKLETSHRVTMDTSVELRFAPVKGVNSSRIKDGVFEEILRLEQLFSRSISGSEINRINDAAGKEPVQVSPEVFFVTDKALEFAGLSRGAFDPTIAPLIDLWGFLGQDYKLPTAADIEQKLVLVDFSLVETDSILSTIYLPREGMALELGGIAKGFVVDRALEVLSKMGVEHAFINAGGDIGLIGTKPDGSPWRIGVRHPREENKIIAVLPVTGGAVVTSGDYQRVFEEAGVSYHHIIDPETGMPARGLASVTVLAPTVIEADALSTAVFVLGPVGGMALIESRPGAEAILITPDLKMLISSGLEGIVELNP